MREGCLVETALSSGSEDCIRAEVVVMATASRAPIVTVFRRLFREAWGTLALESTMQDIRYGIRQLRRNPAFAFSGILVMALGIAVVTVVFSIVYGVLLRDLPYDQPDRLVTLGSARRDAGFQGAYAGAAEYFDWRQQQQVLDDLGLTRPVANYNLTGIAEPERLQGARATASVFRPCGCDLQLVASLRRRNNSTPEGHRASPC
jgi:hypothetical protein